MPYAPFYELFPDLAKKETRSITVLQDGDLPCGSYGFAESFCDEKGCDCRRVFIQVLADTTTGLGRDRPIATISFGWENAAFYRKWASYPLSKEDLHELMGPALPRLTYQTEHAPVLLEHFKVIIKDKAYVERIVRHYKVYREVIDGDRVPAKVTPIRAEAKPGMNQPCPCGSGKKYKKCCWGKATNQPPKTR